MVCLRLLKDSCSGRHNSWSAFRLGMISYVMANRRRRGRKYVDLLQMGKLPRIFQVAEGFDFRQSGILLVILLDEFL